MVELNPSWLAVTGSFATLGYIVLRDILSRLRPSGVVRFGYDSSGRTDSEPGVGGAGEVGVDVTVINKEATDTMTVREVLLENDRGGRCDLPNPDNHPPLPSEVEPDSNLYLSYSLPLTDSERRRFFENGEEFRAVVGVNGWKTLRSTEKEKNRMLRGER